MLVTIISFGVIKDLFGSSSIAIEISSDSKVKDLVAKLKSIYPGLEQLSSFAVALNGVYATTDMLINANDEIALIPPVSGG